MDRSAPDPLTAIRERIDRIDETMHRLLIDRSAVIAELIRVKGTSKPGAAFRPDREADMMRRIVLRHEGDLPLVTVEHIWREIITTFTAMQSPFGIVTAPMPSGGAADALALRDLVRFYFGFSVPVAEAASAAEAIARVAGPGNELAIVPLGGEGRWWASLAGAEAPKVFARLPFIEADARPASLPAYVVGPRLLDPAPADLHLYALADSGDARAALAQAGCAIVARAEGELLVEAPTTLEDEDAASLGLAAGSEFGAFARPIRIVAENVATERAAS